MLVAGLIFLLAVSCGQMPICPASILRSLVNIAHVIKSSRTLRAARTSKRRAPNFRSRSEISDNRRLYRACP
jgi:hypothetical protein